MSTTSSHSTSPESTAPSDAATPAPLLTPFEAQVVEVFTDLVQLLGSNKLVELNLPDREGLRMSVEMPADVFCDRGATVGLNFVKERVHLFDPLTTTNLALS